MQRLRQDIAMRTDRLPAMLWLCVLATAAASAQPPQPQRPQLQRRSAEELALRRPAASRQVVLNVVVTDRKGHPVTGLKRDDFTLLENNVAQKLTHLEEHAPLDPANASQQPARETLPPNVFTNQLPLSEGRATMVILLDALDTSASMQEYLQSQLSEYLRTVPPGTQMAIFQLDTRLRMIQGVTDDRNLLVAATAGKRFLPGDPAGPGTYTVQSAYVAALHLYQTTLGHLDDAARRHILSDGLQSLGQYLAAFPGRKNLVWFTPSIPVPLGGAAPGHPFPDSVEPEDQSGERVDVLTLNPIAVYPLDTRSTHVGSLDFGGRTRMSAIEDFNSGQGNGSLDDVADATGGKAFHPDSGLADAFAEIAATGSHYYTLTYTPANQALDGTERRVKIRTTQPGMQLEYRHAYYASRDGWVMKSPVPAASPVSELHSRTTMALAMTLHAAVPPEVVFRAKINVLPDVLPVVLPGQLPGKPPLKANSMDDKRAGPGSRNIEIQFSADTSAMHFALGPDGKYHDRIDFAVLVYDEDGKLIDGSIAKVQAEIDDAAYQDAGPNRVAAVQTIAVPLQGKYFLRLGVHDLGGNRVGALETPLDAIKLP